MTECPPPPPAQAYPPPPPLPQALTVGLYTGPRPMPMEQPNTAGLCDTEVRYIERTALTLSPKELLYRDAFCTEYIKDFNAKNAMMRMGYLNAHTARQRAVQLLKETYVQQQLDRLVRTLKPTDIVSRQQVMLGLLKEANNGLNEGGVRVAAWAHLGKMLGMYEGKDDESKPKQQMGVMFVPVMQIDHWEQQAQIHQAVLKQTAGSPPVALDKPVIDI